MKTFKPDMSTVGMDGSTRRRFLGMSGLATTVGFTGCLRTLSGGSSTPTPANKDTDGDGVIDSEDYAPRDPEVQREEQVKSDATPTEGQPPTETETPTDPPSAQFEDGFEDGKFNDNWSIVWLTANTNPLNDWGVDQEYPDTGSYALHLHSDGDRNTIATTERILNLDSDFTLEYSYYTPDENSRGVRAMATDIDQNGSEQSRIQNIDTIAVGTARRSPNADRFAAFSSLGFERRFDVNTFPPNQYNHIRVERRGDIITGYRNGSQLARGEINLSSIDLNLSRNYRLMFVSSGGYGYESNIWIDNVSFSADS